MNCLRCVKDITKCRHAARGLCSACYRKAQRNGTLEDYPRRLKRAQDVAEDVEFLRKLDIPMDKIAERIGLHPLSVQRALSRARSRGLADAAGASGTPGGP